MADEAPAPNRLAPDRPAPRPPRYPKRGDMRVDRAPQKPPLLPWSPRRFLRILLVAIFAPPTNRIRIPYNPHFLTQVRDGNVEEISAKGDSIQGKLKKEVKYKGDKAKDFKTEIPTFANRRELSSLLTQENVTINAESPSSRSLLQTLLFSF